MWPTEPLHHDVEAAGSAMPQRDEALPSINQQPAAAGRARRLARRRPFTRTSAGHRRFRRGPSPALPFTVTRRVLVHAGAVVADMTLDDDREIAIESAGERSREHRQLRFIIHDPDVAIQKKTEDVLHWMAFNIPGSARRTPEGVPADAKLPDGTIQGKNREAWSVTGGLERPPRGHTSLHAGTFALDTKLDLGLTLRVPNV